MKKYFPNDKSYSLDKFFSRYTEYLSKALNSIDTEKMEEVLEALLTNINSGGTIYSCGNGGSSSIAEHLVCDFVKGASANSSVEPKVVALLSTPILTAVANDLSYEEIFSFQIKKYATDKDILLSISSSGNSENIIQAIEAAKSLGILTIRFVGFDGGKAKEISDLCLHVSSDNYGICEDAHHTLMHILAQYIRLSFIEDSNKLGSLKF